MNARDRGERRQEREGMLSSRLLASRYFLADFPRLYDLIETNSASRYLNASREDFEIDFRNILLHKNIRNILSLPNMIEPCTMLAAANFLQTGFQDILVRFRHVLMYAHVSDDC